MNQITEYSPSQTGYKDTFTTFTIIKNDGNVFYVLYLGTINDVYGGDTLRVYGLPLEMSSYENASGGTTLCPVLAGAYVSSGEEDTPDGLEP